MFCSFVAFVIYVTTWNNEATAKPTIDDILSKTENGIKDHSGNQKRTAKIISFSTLEGIRAAKLLLQDAKQIIFSPSGKIFEKVGGYEQAKKDFDLVKPTHVQQDTVHADMKRGKVGDREITLQKNGWMGNPTVYLIKDHEGPFRAGAIDTVVYRDVNR